MQAQDSADVGTAARYQADLIERASRDFPREEAEQIIRWLQLPPGEGAMNQDEMRLRMADLRFVGRAIPREGPQATWHQMPCISEAARKVSEKLRAGDADLDEVDRLLREIGERASTARASFWRWRGELRMADAPAPSDAMLAIAMQAACPGSVEGEEIPGEEIDIEAAVRAVYPLVQAQVEAEYRSRIESESARQAAWEAVNTRCKIRIGIELTDLAIDTALGIARQPRARPYTTDEWAEFSEADREIIGEIGSDD